jgi:hypothetical protein
MNAFKRDSIQQGAKLRCKGDMKDGIMMISFNNYFGHVTYLLDFIVNWIYQWIKSIQQSLPLYTRSQDHESLGPNNSILNLLLGIFIKTHLVLKSKFDFRICVEYFIGLGPKWCHIVILTYFGLNLHCKVPQVLKPTGYQQTQEVGWTSLSYLYPIYWLLKWPDKLKTNVARNTSWRSQTLRLPYTATLLGQQWPGNLRKIFYHQNPNVLQQCCIEVQRAGTNCRQKCVGRNVEGLAVPKPVN